MTSLVADGTSKVMGGGECVVCTLLHLLGYYIFWVIVHLVGMSLEPMV
jgi:hypothetical protein